MEKDIEMEREHVLAEVVQAMGLQALKPKQKEAVMVFLAGRDVLSLYQQAMASQLYMLYYQEYLIG